MNFKKGQVYKALRDIPVIYMTSWAAPCSGGRENILPNGELFEVLSDSTGNFPSLYAAPLNYEGLQEKFIPEDERKNPLYRGFYLSIRKAIVNADCTLIEGGKK